MRVMVLRTGERLELAVSAGQTLTCRAGSVRIGARVLAPGGTLTFEAAGVASLTVLEGTPDEWLQDTGIVVIALKAPAG